MLIKRIFDFIIAISGIILSTPLWIIFILLIWLENKDSVLYFQERVGKGGKIFKSIQFRSMVPGAEKDVGPLQAKEHDPRVTRIGRILRMTALDELPQLINIAKGDMSFVGPRALRPLEIDSHDTKPKSIWDFEGAKERCQVRPGLTGVAQVLLPRNASRQDKFKYDIWYIKNKTLCLDIYLMALSFLVTFRGH